MADALDELMLTDVADGIGTITINRPRRKNALTAEMFARLDEILIGWRDDPDVRVVVITGTGDAFCAGADIGGGDDDAGGDDADAAPMHHINRMRRVHRGAATLHDFPKPTVAKVNGVAVGAGMNLALGADLVYMARSARMSSIFVRRGLSLDWGGSWLLPRLVGMHRAKELALLGDMVSADDALAMGLANAVIDDAALDGHVAGIAARLASGPPIAMEMTKQLLHASDTRTMDEALEAESRTQAINFGTRDTAEAMAAFAEKRDPHFTGR